MRKNVEKRINLIIQDHESWDSSKIVFKTVTEDNLGVLHWTWKYFLLWNTYAQILEKYINWTRHFKKSPTFWNFLIIFGEKKSIPFFLVQAFASDTLIIFRQSPDWFPSFFGGKKFILVLPIFVLLREKALRSNEKIGRFLISLWVKARENRSIESMKNYHFKSKDWKTNRIFINIERVEDRSVDFISTDHWISSI